MWRLEPPEARVDVEKSLRNSRPTLTFIKHRTKPSKGVLVLRNVALKNALRVDIYAKAINIYEVPFIWSYVHYIWVLLTFFRFLIQFF